MIRVAVASMVFAGVSLAAVKPRPLSLIVLLDVTSSTSEAMATARAVYPYDKPGADITGARETLPKPEIIKEPNGPDDLFLTPMLKTVIPGLAPSDRARIGSISSTFRLSSEFTRDTDALERATRVALDVPEVDRYGASPLWDAIDSAVTALEREPGRRAIILVTDGLSTGNRLGFDVALEHARRANVAVSVICEWWGMPRTARAGIGFGFVQMKWTTNWPWKMLSPFHEPPDLKMERLSVATGGLFVPDGEDSSNPKVAAAFTHVLAFLHGVEAHPEATR